MRELKKVHIQRLGQPVHPDLQNRLGLQWDDYLHVNRFPSAPAIANQSPGSARPSPEKFIYAMRGCDVHVPSGLAFQDSVLLEQSIPLWRDGRIEALRHRVVSGRNSSDASPTVAYPVFPIPRGTTYNYYHFVVEYLPRLIRAKRAFPDLRATVYKPEEHVRESLQLLGIPIVDATTWVSPDILVLVDPVTPNWVHPEDAGLLRALSGEFAGEDNATEEKRIFLSRRGASRQLNSEEALCDYLSERGFTVVSEQDGNGRGLTNHMKLFRSASTVVGVHGAGLANALWAQRSLRVVEIRPRSMTLGDETDETEMYRNICAVRGDTYTLITLESSEHRFGSGLDAIPALDRLDL